MLEYIDDDGVQDIYPYQMHQHHPVTIVIGILG